jgi:peptidase A4-like protein
MVMPPKMDVLPSNEREWPRQPPPRRGRTARTLGLLLAVAAVCGLLGVIQTFVGIDQLTRWAVSIAGSARLPGSDPPESSNWAGYTVTGGTYSAVSATWSVPEFAPDSPAGADAIWVGIGGVHSTDLIQAGTEETVSGRGSTQYQAWVETLPQVSRAVPLPINTGDSVSVSLQQQTGGDWLVAFVNNTSGKSYQETIQYASSRSSAEWVVEAPSGRRGRLVPLDAFRSVSFSRASTVKDGQIMSIQQAGGHPITMIGQRRQALARPSTLEEDGASFEVRQSQL